jgi:hypothetical protein
LVLQFGQADNRIEKYLPSAFSKITWKDVESWFGNLDKSLPNDHHRIRTYRLRRSRMPMIVFEKLVGELDGSILRVGHRMSLGTEAAVHQYISPVGTSDCLFSSTGS